MTEGTSSSTWRKVGRTVFATSAALALSTAALGSPASAAEDTSGKDRVGRSGPLATLKGTVGPGFTISLNKSSVPAGKYKLVVADKSTIHNFHLMGAGVDVSTTVPFTGKKTFKIKLKTGTYRAQCDPHSGSMNLDLTVT